MQAVWPETRITWVIGRTEFGLMQGVEGIEFITFDKNRPWASLAGVRARTRGRRYPLLLHMHASMRANLASCMITADRRIGFDRARARDQQWLFTNEKIAAQPRQHVMDGLFGFLEHLGIHERVLRWDIPVSEEDRNWARTQCGDGAPVVVISPCSSQRFRNYRNWSVEHYATLIARLQDTWGAHVLLTGGNTATERLYGEKLQAAAARPIVNLIGHTTLKQLLAIIDEANAVICPDSGPAHMATAVGTPVIGLYATSNRQRTGPYFSQELVVDAYPRAVQQEFARSEASLRFGRRVRDPRAMDLIQVDDVIAKVALVLQK